MSFKTLLVHVEAEPAADPRLALAIDLANQFDAKLIGVGADINDPFASYGGAYEAGPLIVAQIEAVQSDLKRAEAKFRSAATALRHGSDWRVAMRFPVSGIAEEACAADLVVTSRSSGATATHERDAWPGGLILQAGRPVLVTPPGAAQLKARRIAIAWKDSRDARRAISDALPCLERADAVLLVEVCSDEDAASAQKRLADVAAGLLQHGIKATSSVTFAAPNSSNVEQFLEVAAGQDADLIVAGGYGHSRLQEWVFGGFTRVLLAQTTRAVMFSH